MSFRHCCHEIKSCGTTSFVVLCYSPLNSFTFKENRNREKQGWKGLKRNRRRKDREDN
jgi:hypothetical protein